MLSDSVWAADSMVEKALNDVLNDIQDPKVRRGVCGLVAKTYLAYKDVIGMAHDHEVDLYREMERHEYRSNPLKRFEDTGMHAFLTAMKKYADMSREDR